MDEYFRTGGRKLRPGYTTGSCAAAAAAAAAWLLLAGERRESVRLEAPGGAVLTLPVEELALTGGGARAAVRKDAGDDPDVTGGALIAAEVSRTGAGIAIDGGPGVGRVTKPGLDQPVGAAAINSVPRRMIGDALRRVLEETGCSGGLRVVISVPEGEKLAGKTFNPRLGIVGGVSILGTTGVVEPMSSRAVVETIRAELSQRRALGQAYALLTPGNYGAAFLRDELRLDPGRAVLISNFAGDALDLCRELGFRGALLVGHIGKLVKLAGGMFNTHSQYGDCRLELLAAMAGAEGLPPEQIAAVLDCVSCDAGLEIIRQAGLLEKTMERLTARAAAHLRRRAGAELEAGCVIFSQGFGPLAETKNAARLLRLIREG